MEQCRVKNLYSLSETIAAELLERAEYPWEALQGIREFILKIGPMLDPAVLIIDEEAEIRHCAFIRGSAIIGKGSVVGNSTELKNVILFNSVQVPHYNYVGDSVLGYKSHMGAGSITSNVKSDKTLVVVKDKEADCDGTEKIWRNVRRLC